MHTQDNPLSKFFKESARSALFNQWGLEGPWGGGRAKNTNSKPNTPTKKNTNLKPAKDPIPHKSTPKAGRTYTELTSKWPSKPVGRSLTGKAKIAGILTLLGVGGPGVAHFVGRGDDEDVVDYGKAEEAAPTPDTEAPSGPDPVTYGAGGALLGGGVSHAWGKMAGRPDLARDLIAAIGTGLTGAAYAATRESNE